MPNVALSYKQFPFGPTLGGGMSFMGVTGTNIDAEAPNIEDMGFLFWNLTYGNAREVIQNRSFSHQLTADSLIATGWYIATGGGGTCTAIRPYAFSTTSNSFYEVSPIEGVSPNNAWAGSGDTTVTVENSNVVITVQDRIGNEVFDSWLIFGNATPDGLTVSVPAGKCPLIIAVYKQEPFIGIVGTEGIKIEWKEFIKLIDWMRGEIEFDPITDPAPFDYRRFMEAMRSYSAKTAVSPDPRTTRKVTAGRKKTAKKKVSRKKK